MNSLPEFVAVLDNIRSLHNVGAIFRTADGAGVQKLYLCGMTATPPRAEIRKAALGAEEYVAWEYFPTTAAALAALKSEGYLLLALENTPASTDYRAARLRAPLALIVGHEFDGIRPEILAQCDGVISLPMRGRKNSLNVAVAFGIAAYEIANRLWPEVK
ncbi:MAG: RNA methyltransferase [candidate division KSB1 bacterium]|nr:RNA methyltransferase [candidate division KSB1 bacterium]MDZ7274629.1 RNA methyltransferase [candidate division KSB1 bacterium]MDZ7285454.1 RNA methyltransferase [candidate division KSB1 bacterium]MDZ7298486.1 RNA methyltransferase [candidate division KSB1 bacterium]MDZ7306970.1 RNA methyltransferase [candidate division KSB1 bacterium]